MYYFDYLATTPVDPRVIEKMNHYLGVDGIFGNPSSVTHAYGQAALRAVEVARGQVAETIHASSSEIIFTSGATESNQLALMGAARLYQRKGKHLITSKTEHSSVLGVMHELEREGFEVTYLRPEPDGLINLAVLEAAIRTDTILVSLMHVNNETGVIQPLEKISQLLKGKGIVFHVDAAQSVGKVEVNVDSLKVDLMSLCAHKAYGPKGIGALYIRETPRIRICPQTFGGGQERGYRAGTLATHQIVGMGEAFRIAQQDKAKDMKKCLAFKAQLWDALSALGGVHLNGHQTQCVSGVLNFWVEGVTGEHLLSALPMLALSSHSACSSALHQASYVLKAMGLTDAQALSAIRFSMGRFTTAQDIKAAMEHLTTAIQTLRKGN